MPPGPVGCHKHWPKPSTAVIGETCPGPAEPLLSKNTKQLWGQRLSCASPARPGSSHSGQVMTTESPWLGTFHLQPQDPLFLEAGFMWGCRWLQDPPCPSSASPSTHRSPSPSELRGRAHSSSPTGLQAELLIQTEQMRWQRWDHAGVAGSDIPACPGTCIQLAPAPSSTH